MNSWSEKRLAPFELDTAGIPDFLGLTLSSLGWLSNDDVVQQYIAAEPRALAAIRALSTAVAAAGVRIRDSGRMHGSFDDNLALYSAEEIWMFDLAIDVIAMLSTLGGLTPETRAPIIRNLGPLDERVRTLHWKREVHKAGAGPAEFLELRAHVPHHKPHRDR
jgi:hypothetical protein